MYEEDRHMLNRILIAGVCVAAGVSGIAIWRMQQTDAATLPNVTAPAVPVVAEKVRVSDMPIVLTGIGTVTAYNVVDVHAQVTGTIDKIGFTEGQTVHPGDLIAQLDPRQFQASLQQAEAALARDTANLDAAQANLSRYATLVRQGYATPQQVSDQTATVKGLQASVTGDHAAIFNAQTQLGYTSITAPIDGVTGIRAVDIGNIVQPSSATPIVTITQIEPISVVFTLPQNDLQKVQQAMAQGKLHVIASDQTGPKKLDEGTLLLVNNTVNANSGTIQVKATFPNAARTLWPGEFVSVQLILSQRHDAISVPTDALQHGDRGATVFVVGANCAVRQRAVTVSETLDGWALIDKGLKPDDVVVTQGQYRLDDGITVVRVKPGDPAVQNSSEASGGMLG
jgi:multidrug efflux system membrane fusion protein